MTRYHSNKDRRKREQRKRAAKKFHIEQFNDTHNWNKKHPLDCGNAKCYMCHGEKLLRYTKPRDYRAKEKFEHQIDEYFNHDYEFEDWCCWLENYEDGCSDEEEVKRWGYKGFSNLNTGDTSWQQLLNFYHKLNLRPTTKKFTMRLSEIPRST